MRAIDFDDAIDDFARRASVLPATCRECVSIAVYSKVSKEKKLCLH